MMADLRRASPAAGGSGQSLPALVHPSIVASNPQFADAGAVSSCARRWGRTPGPHEGSNHLVCSRARLLFLALALDELDVHLRAVHPNQFATSIGQPGRRQQQEKLLQIEALD